MAGPREWSPRGKQIVLKAELGMAGDMIDWHPPEHECFVITITREYAQALLNRRAIFMNALRADKELWEMYFWDASGEYYGVDWDTSTDELDEDGRENVVPNLSKPGRTEVDQAIIREDEVCWTAMPKHGSVYIVTAPVKWREIQQIAAMKKGR